MAKTRSSSPKTAKKAAGKTAGAQTSTAKKAAGKKVARKKAAGKKVAAKTATGSNAESIVATGKSGASKPAAAKKSSGRAKAKGKAAGTSSVKSAKSSPKAAKASASPKRRSGGTQLVIVESPAKAKTINKYLGSEFTVRASVGHIRDLPTKSPKGAKQPVPGVDLDNRFAPTYVVLAGKAKTVAELKKVAKTASDVWFATDLDREGEAIAWHLAQVLGIDPKRAKRVVFNAITRSEVQRAFGHPQAIDEDKVNAQQARRILDRIVGYQASPLLWKKVARGLSAGRVQSVAVRLVVEREREIAAFVPDESWRITANLALDPAQSTALEPAWADFLAQRDEKGKGPTIKLQNAWLAEQAGLKTELYALGENRFSLGCPAAAPRDLTGEAVAAAEAVGLLDVRVESRENPQGKGPARVLRHLHGKVDPKARYAVQAIETKRTTSRPSPPFITSSLQIAAANGLGFTAQRTMRTAQSLYEGIEVAGEGLVGLITYMRTDSTHLSPEALAQAREHIGKAFGADYLPASANVYGASKNAQEAHEAIRPTDPQRTPDLLKASLTDEQYRLYRLIWSRFLASQMTPAQWDATSVTFVRKDRPTGAVLRTTGRTLVFDGHYRVTGVPTASDEQILPELAQGQELAPFAIDPEQRFSSPPPRYSEASLVKTLEAEGIGRPSTYASIISVIQDRKYVEQLDRRFYATDLGEVVTDKLIEAFPDLMDVGYTRQMEAKLDAIEESHADWVDMLEQFYGGFSAAVETAHEELTHAKAEIQMAPYKCPMCGSRTAYRFGKNGRFLSCMAYPECAYSAPIDRDGRPMLPERVNIACPEDGSTMELRVGRFGSFLTSVNYPDTTFVLNLDKKGGVKYPVPPPYRTELSCPRCESPLNLRRGKRGPWLGCSAFPKCRGRLAWNSVDEETREGLEAALVEHESKHPIPPIKTLDGQVITEGTPVVQLVLPGGVAELEVHPDARDGEAGETIVLDNPQPSA